ncbi:MAG TPA: hypothetical protein VGC56_06975 [Allosphingosinicella sp.]|jgi:hypothetical protein
MSPSFRRIGPFILVTLVYWPIALIFLGLATMGDCFDAACEAGRAPALWRLLAGEAALYGIIIFVMIRRRTAL